VRDDQVADGLFREGRSSGYHLEQDATERVDVGTSVEVRLGAALLRGHIERRSDEVAALREPGRCIRSDLCESKVEHLGSELVRRLFVGNEKQIVRLQIAMNHARGVRSGDRVRDLRSKRRRQCDRQWFLSTKSRAEALSLQELHDDVATASFVFAIVEDVHDARMPDRCRRLCLGEEALRVCGVLHQTILNELDDRLAAERDVLGQVHDAHPSGAQEANNSVVADDLVDERGCAAGERLHQHEGRGLVLALLELELWLDLLCRALVDADALRTSTQNCECAIDDSLCDCGPTSFGTTCRDRDARLGQCVADLEGRTRCARRIVPDHAKHAIIAFLDGAILLLDERTHARDLIVCRRCVGELDYHRRDEPKRRLHGWRSSERAEDGVRVEIVAVVRTAHVTVCRAIPTLQRACEARSSGAETAFAVDRTHA
jgi:hypothetical protein